jgi:hypothetical protein
VLDLFVFVIVAETDKPQGLMFMIAINEKFHPTFFRAWTERTDAMSLGAIARERVPKPAHRRFAEAFANTEMNRGCAISGQSAPSARVAIPWGHACDSRSWLDLPS